MDGPPLSRKRAPDDSATRREQAEPDEHVRPLPWFFIMFLGAMGMWGAFYIVSTPSGEASAYGDQRSVTTLRPPVAAVGAVLNWTRPVYFRYNAVSSCPCTR